MRAAAAGKQQIIRAVEAGAKAAAAAVLKAAPAPEPIPTVSITSSGANVPVPNLSAPREPEPETPAQLIVRYENAKVELGKALATAVAKLNVLKNDFGIQDVLSNPAYAEYVSQLDIGTTSTTSATSASGASQTRGKFDLDLTIKTLGTAEMWIGDLAEKLGVGVQTLNKQLDKHAKLFVIRKEDANNERSKKLIKAK